ncbi:MAG: NAD(P)H-quinone oxidoreductase [Clostridia bacterium]|nr:NAD(P)H-quinone oxidoreductase [Clostridia bacterium]
MKAILVNPIDNSLSWSDVPDPIVGAEDVLVEIHYAALNRADLMQRAGDYPPPPGCPDWMGLEVAGYIREMGPVAREKSSVRRGDAVCALLGGGGYAEYVNVKYDMLMPVPAGVSLCEAAAMPEAFCTAYLNLFREAGAKPGETLLMPAGASGLASVTIPMAKAFGLRVITTVRTAAQAEAIAPLGADIVVNTSGENLLNVLKAQLEAGTPVDIAIDCLGGSTVGDAMPYLARGARWVMIAALAGMKTEVDLKTVYVRNVRLIGSTLRSRAPEYKAALIADLVKIVWPMVEAGKVRPTIYRVLPITEAEAAHDILARGGHNGKVVLQIR